MLVDLAELVETIAVEEVTVEAFVVVAPVLETLDLLLVGIVDDRVAKLVEDFEDARVLEVALLADEDLDWLALAVVEMRAEDDLVLVGSVD